MTSAIVLLAAQVAIAPARGVPAGCDPSVMSEKYWAVWNADEQARIDADIEANRKADGEFAVNAPAGTEVKVEQVSHDFRFGAHIFNFNQLGKKEWNDAYKASYGEGGIFNQATVAFYWTNYEPVPGKLRAFGDYTDTERYWNSLSAEEAMHDANWRRPAPGPVIDFLKTKDVRIHGHILVWGSAKPYWIYDWYCPEPEKRAFDRLGIPRHSVQSVRAKAGAEGNFGFAKRWKTAWNEAYKVSSEKEIGALAPEFSKNMRRIFKKRVDDVAGQFGEVVDSWDVVNESSIDWARYRKSRTGLPVWASVYGLMPGDYPLHALLDAKEALPARADLCINDYNIREDFLSQVRDLENEGAKIDVVGCQMHIFNTNDCMRLAQGVTKVNWVGTPDVIQQRLDMMAKTGKRLHVSEITITSPGADEKSRQIQAILTRNIYRKWFSHKALMGITWWNTVDGGGVFGEPLVSGLFTRDLQKKPAYLALDELINGEWKTRTSVKAEAFGKGRKASVVRFRGFRGTYRLSWCEADGTRHEKLVELTGEKTSDLAKPVRETHLVEYPIRHAALPAAAREIREASVYGVFTQAEAAGVKSAADAARAKTAVRASADAHGRFQLGKILSKEPEAGNEPDTVAFVAVKVQAARDCKVNLLVRQDWYGAIFVNGAQAGKDIDGVDPQWTQRTLSFKAGENEVLFRSRPGVGGYWFVGLALDDPENVLTVRP